MADFIVDFISLKSHLIIEADGKYHDTPEQEEADKLRTIFLNKTGFKVLRFTNEEILGNINANVKSVRYELGTRVRHQLRIIPELKFFLDDSLDYVAHIDELLKK